MAYSKNESVEVLIEDIGSDGEGIGKIDGYTLFIKDAIIGDVVEAKIMKAKKNYAYAKLVRIITPSNFRVEPKCAIARQCGGCQIQAMSYERQLAFKQDKVKNHLVRIGKFAAKEVDAMMEPIVGMEEPYRYRNKAQFPFGVDREGKIVTGFYASHSHNIIPNTDCYLGATVNQAILKEITDYMKEAKITTYDETIGKGMVRHALIRVGHNTKEIMVCLVINGKKLPKQELLVEKLCKLEGMTSISISSNRDNTNVIMGKDITVLWGEGYITDTLGTIRFQISPLSFYQVNTIQTEKLYGLALEYAGLSGQETVWDLYCGIGTISLFLAQKAKKVYGVEIVEQAIEDANRNAAINEIDNVEFFVGKAGEVLPREYKEHQVYADVIVVDPPRKGCDEVCLNTMIEMSPKRIVYVSCDSATLARDLRILCDNGYQLEKVRAVDQFCHTTHVETVCLLSRKA